MAFDPSTAQLDGFDPSTAQEEKPRSAPAEVGTAALRGLYQGIGGLGSVVQGAQEAAGVQPGIVARAAKGLETFGKEGAERNAPQTEKHGPVTNFISTAAESLGSSIPVIAGGVVGAPAGPAGVAAGAGGAAAAQAYHEKYQEGLQKGLSDDAAHEYAKNSALLQGGEMAALSLIPGAAAFKKPAANAAEAAAEALSKRFLPEFGKGAAGIVVGNTALGVGGAAGQAAIDKKAGIETPTPWDAAMAAAIPSLAGSVGFLPLAALHALPAAQAKKMQAALADGDAHPLGRAKAINTVYEAMEKADPEGANMWLVNASEALKKKLPIGVTNDWVEGPHPNVFPEAHPEREAFENEGGGQPQGMESHTGIGEPMLPAPGRTSTPGGEGPFDLTVDHARQNAVDANEALWQARDAEESRRRAAFASNGPLSAAAVSGIDSGLVAEKGAERAAEVPEAGEAEPQGNEQEQLNIRSWTRNTSGMSLQQAQQAAQRAAFESGRDYTVVPHPAGDYAILPSQFITPKLQQQYAGLQRGGLVEQPKRVLPLEPEAAQKRAEQLTSQTGVEHEVVPHPLARDKFAVQPKQRQGEANASQTGEQQRNGVEQHQGADAGLQQPGLDRNQQAGVKEKSPQAVGGHLAQEGGAEQPAVTRLDVAQHLMDPDRITRTMSDRGNAEPLSEEHRTQVDKALQFLKDNGADVSRLDTVEALHGQERGSAHMSYHPETKSIGINPDVLEREYKNDTAGLAEVIDHEMWHAADHTPEGRRGGYMILHSDSSPLFDIKSGPEGRTAVGSIIKEALAHFDQDQLFAPLLSYPLRSFRSGLADDAKRKARDTVLKAEVFAQLGRVYNAVPEVMRAELPKAYQLFKAIHDTAKREGISIGDAVGKLLGSAGESGRGVSERGHLDLAPGNDEHAVSARASQKGAASLEDFKQDRVAGLLKKKNWAVLTAENPAGKEMPATMNAARNKRLQADLDKLGVQYEKVIGRYGAPRDEHSFAVTGITAEQARELGKKYGQDSVLTREGLEHMDGSVTPATDVSAHAKAPEDYFTRMPDGSMFTVNLDFDKRTSPTVIPEHIAANLTADEKALLGEARGRVAKVISVFNNLPDKKLYVAAAKAGESARKWYERSLQGIQRVYGEDTQRFLQLMAALSPQTSVKGNFYNAARVFAAWDRAGRPTDYEKLGKIFRDNLVTDQGREDGKKAMAAWTINGSRVLLASDPNATRLSGPKVSSFMANLLGHYDEVTNDRHMADFAGIDPGKSPWNTTEGKFIKKGPAYLALSAKVREAAKELGWTPAETQAAIWSWWNSLKRLTKETGKSAVQLLKDGDLTRDRVAQEPHLGSYLNEPEFGAIDKSRGRRAAELARTEGSENGREGQAAAEEGSRSAPSRADIANARRIDENVAASKERARTTRLANETEAEREDRLEREGMQLNAEQTPSARDLAKPKPPFYSGMDRIIAERAPFSRAGDIPAGQLKMWLAARAKEGLVKNDELQWTGINEWLDLQKGKVTRDQVADFLKEHGVRVEETELGRNVPSEEDIDLLLNDEAGEGMSREDAREYLAMNDEDYPDKTKYHSYQLPGGKNYRELLLTLPNNKADVRPNPKLIVEAIGDRWEVNDINNGERVAGPFISRSAADLSLRALENDVAEGNVAFKSSHFDQPNILAHVRFNDRADANGKKVLFIEELQSDWAQKGRKEGFAKAAPDWKTAKVTREGSAYTATASNGESATFYASEIGREQRVGSQTTEDMVRGMAERRFSAMGSSRVPAAPFVGKTEAWVALALRRMIRYAAENGYDRVAWTNGEQQAERYDLSKHVSAVKAQKLKNGNWGITADKDGRVVIDEQVPDSKLDDTVGKDLAAKIRSEVRAGEPFQMYRGLDLKVGGEGMKSFYDQIVPNVANDVLKKLGGGRVGTAGISMPEATEASGKVRLSRGGSFEIGQPGFDITPAMRAKVMEGQPLFVKDGGSTASARELAAKATGGKAAETEQQFTKSGEPVSEKIDTTQAPKWVQDADETAKAFAKKAGVFRPKESYRTRWANLRKDLGTKILQQAVDQYYPVLKNIGKYPYQLLRMASSGDNGLAALVRDGQVELNKFGAIAIKQGTTSFSKVMASLAGEHDRWFAWMAAQRAKALMAEGRENLFTPEEIEAGLQFNKSMGEGDVWKGEGTRAMAYAKAMKDFNEINQSVLDVGEAAGIIDPEARQAFTREFYVPFFREKENGTLEVNPANISGMVNQYGVKRLKGGEDELHDLMANTMQNWSHILSASLKNNAATKTLEAAEELGIARRIKSGEHAAGDVFTLRGGKEQHWRVEDPLVLQSISSMQATPFRGPMMKGLGMMKHALTVGTTWSPIFRIRHTVREQVTALATVNVGGYNPVKNWVDGLKYSSKNNPEWGNAQAGGAVFHMGMDLQENRAAFVKRLIAHEIDPSTLVDSEHKALKMLGHLADWWKETGERSDSITRANVYRETYAKMIAEGHDPERAHFEAAYEARDVLDYSLHGINPAIRAISQVVPFMNARIQGLYKLGRGAADNPKRFSAVVGTITLATIALSLAQRDDKDIQNASEWDRDNNWLIKVGNVIYRVPKPFEVGAMATLADRGLETALNGFTPADRERFVSRLFPIIGAQLNLNPVPQAVWPAIELWANKDVFSGQHIEPARDERLSPTERIGAHTSIAAQLASKGMNTVLPDTLTLSPQQIDFAVAAYLGWVGTHVVNTADLALRATGQFPDKPSPRLDDYFLIGDFAHQAPQDNSRFVEQYYTHMQKIQEAFGDLRELQKTGQTERAIQVMQDKKDLIGLHGLYLRTQRQIGQLNSRMRYVNMSNMDPDQKRVEIDRISQLKNVLTKSAEDARAAAINRE